MFRVAVWIVVQFASVLITNGSAECNSLTVWQCDNGDCIHISKRCDGIPQCADASDESVSECMSFYCHDSKFRCAYGGCINKELECNGVKDCFDNSDELTEKCIPDIERKFRGNCSAEEFHCRSGECIPLDILCDGSRNCQDGSDEIVESCASKCCPPFGFRCGYGGCIDERDRCDEKVDCIDASDENYLLCGYPKGYVPTTTTTTTTTVRSPTASENNDLLYRIVPDNSTKTVALGSCQVHKVPRNGWIEYDSPWNEKVLFSEYVDEYSKVFYRCLDNHIADGSDNNFCNNGTWTGPVPDCVPRCNATLITGLSIMPVSCTLDNIEMDCSQPAQPGTIARINCRNRYERDIASRQQIIICGENGAWSPVENCNPICGEEYPDGGPFVVGGVVGNITKVPWHVGIYKAYNNAFSYHCGGSIISARLVISAMHCFWDPKADRVQDKSVFRIAAGKTLIDYNDIESLPDQKFEVDRLIYDPGYMDYANNYVADVVLVVLNKNIIFQPHIGPVCVPYGLMYEEKTVPVGWKGRVAGWGLTRSGGQTSGNLKIVEIPVVDRNECKRRVPAGFVPHITPDKFCAGFWNEMVSVCEGDSGGGLVFPKGERNRTVYYLRGIVSTGPRKENSCDSNQITTFTNYLYYEEMISYYDVFYRPKK